MTSTPLASLLVLAASPPGSLRAVVSDVDGTLFAFGTSQELSSRNHAALSRCMDVGIHVCLATGRLPGPWSDRVKRELPGLGPCVFGNGALVVGADGSPLWESKLPRDVLAAVLDHVRGGVSGGDDNARLSVLAATRWPDEDDGGHGVRYCELAPVGPTHITELIRAAGEPEPVLLPSLEGFEERHVLKFVIWTKPGAPGWASMPDTVAALKRLLAPTGATLLHHGDRWCEVLPPGVNKGSGMVRMLETLGVAAAEVLACGDAENDVEMLKLAGVGAAMANAQPAALDAADVVVSSNADDGVAEAVERFVLANR